MGLKQQLDRELEWFPPSELWAEIESRATRPGPTELPAPDGGRGGLPRRRLVAASVAFVVFLGAFAILWSAFRASPRPAEPNPRPTHVDGPRRNGELIQFADMAGSSGLFLAAQDPGTGELRLFADTSAVIDCYGREPCHTYPGLAAWSADGRWVAFDVYCSRDCPSLDRQRQGLWVVGVGGEPRQITDPCASCDLNNLVWAWGPADTGVAYADPYSGERELIVFDPSDGTRRSMGRVDDRITALSWTPDGNGIAVAAGGALYLVDLGNGEWSRIATYQGVVGEGWASGWPAGIKWSPDGTRIALVIWRDPTRSVQGLEHTSVVQVLDAEGSELFVLPVPGGGPFRGGPEAWWSPDGTQIAYATNVQYRKGSGAWVMHGGQIWTVASDGSNPTMIFDPGCCEATYLRPTWSPDGSRLAFEVSNRSSPWTQWFVVDIGDVGEPQPIEELTVRSWRGGSFASGGGWTPGHLG